MGSKNAVICAQLCANKCALGVALAGAGITRRRRSSWQRVAEAVAAAPARAAPVLAVAKVAAGEDQAQVTPAAGQARPVSRPAATGRTRHRHQASNASRNGICNGCNALQVTAPNRSTTPSIPLRKGCRAKPPPCQHGIRTLYSSCTCRAQVVAIAGAAATLQANLVRIEQVRSTVRMKTSTSATALRRAPITHIVFCLRKRDGVTRSARA